MMIRCSLWRDEASYIDWAVDGMDEAKVGRGRLSRGVVAALGV